MPRIRIYHALHGHSHRSTIIVESLGLGMFSILGRWKFTGSKQPWSMSLIRSLRHDFKLLIAPNRDHEQPDPRFQQLLWDLAPSPAAGHAMHHPLQTKLHQIGEK